MDEAYILVTGASSSIGRASIKKIRSMTDQPIILAQRSETKNDAIKNTEIFYFDASNSNSVEDFANRIRGLTVSYYIQFHGDAIPDDDLESQTFSKLDSLFKINSFSNVILLKSILPRMKVQNFGRILLMSTASSEYGGGQSSFGYGLSKHSIIFLTKYLAKYYTHYNILTNCVSPGLFLTDFHTKRMNRTSEQIENRIKSIRLGRSGTLKEISDLEF